MNVQTCMKKKLKEPELGLHAMENFYGKRQEKGEKTNGII